MSRWWRVRRVHAVFVGKTFIIVPHNPCRFTRRFQSRIRHDLWRQSWLTLVTVILLRSLVWPRITEPDFVASRFHPFYRLSFMIFLKKFSKYFIGTVSSFDPSPRSRKPRSGMGFPFIQDSPKMSRISKPALYLPELFSVDEERYPRAKYCVTRVQGTTTRITTSTEKQNNNRAMYT